MSEGEPATFVYLRKAAETVPPFTEKDERRLLESLLGNISSSKSLIPEMIELFGVSASKDLAVRVEQLASADLARSEDRVARAAIKWTGQVERFINPPPRPEPRYHNYEDPYENSSYSRSY